MVSLHARRHSLTYHAYVTQPSLTVRPAVANKLRGDSLFLGYDVGLPISPNPYQ